LRFRSYHELLFMIDTCQANTMYSKFYSPNIIATGSSEIDQSSYSHHADSDVGVAVIDRYTYYNLDFLETQVREPSSKLMLGDLFDSYDEAKIHSHPGIRYDLFPGGERAARERLVMDFFGNVQNVEIENLQDANETQWKEDLEQLGKMIAAARGHANGTQPATYVPGVDKAETTVEHPMRRAEGAARVDADSGWQRRALGVAAFLALGGAWVAGSWFDQQSVG